MAVTRRREEVAFPSAPDPRFGGNLARATEGAQYPSGMVTGRSGNIRAPMVDQRYENYQAPHRVDYTSPRPPIQTGTPNFRPPYGAPGQPSFATWQQQIDPYPEFNPRPNLKGRFQEPAFHKFPQSGPAGAPVKGPWNREYDTPMRGGLGGLEEQAAIPNWYKWYDKLINRFGKERGSELWHQYASDDTGIGNNEYQMAEFGGYGYSPNPYDDDEYGPFVPPSVIDMDLEGIGYDPADDEYDFDRKRGFPGRKFGRGHKKPAYSARGGLMSLRR